MMWVKGRYDKCLGFRAAANLLVWAATVLPTQTVSKCSRPPQVVINATLLPTQAVFLWEPMGAAYNPIWLPYHIRHLHLHLNVVRKELSSAIAVRLAIAHDSAVSPIVESLLVNRRLMQLMLRHLNKISNQHAVSARGQWTEVVRNREVSLQQMAKIFHLSSAHYEFGPPKIFLIGLWNVGFRILNLLLNKCS